MRRHTQPPIWWILYFHLKWNRITHVVDSKSCLCTTNENRKKRPKTKEQDALNMAIKRYKTVRGIITTAHKTSRKKAKKKQTNFTRDKIENRLKRRAVKHTYKYVTCNVLYRAKSTQSRVESSVKRQLFFIAGKFLRLSQSTYSHMCLVCVTHTHYFLFHFFVAAPIISHVHLFVGCNCLNWNS